MTYQRNFAITIPSIVALAMLGSFLYETSINRQLTANFNGISRLNAMIEAENDSLKKENAALKARLGSAGSAPMGAAQGGIWDTVVEGKNAVAIVTSALVVSKAATSDERYEKFVAFINSVADKTDSKGIDLFAALATNPSKETFKPLLDFGLQK